MLLPNIVKILTNSGIEQNEAIAEVKILLRHFANMTEMDLLCGREIPQENLIAVEQAAKLRAQTHQPIQYITGFAYFMGKDYVVNPSVLIPRDETEILVNEAIKIIKENNFIQVMDMCCGSGCITCSVAMNTDARILGVDISTEAIKTAFLNMERFELFNRAVFRKSDLFSKIREDEKFQMIISNPPYISPLLKPNIQEEVHFEPELALYTNDSEGLEFYQKIIEQSPNFLETEGYLLFELGEGQSKSVKNILLKNGFSGIRVIKDLAQIDRVIVAQLQT